jgi:cell division control protein 45
MGCITKSYTSGKGGIIVFDDGDIQGDLNAERDAYFALEEMPEVDEVDDSVSLATDSDDDSDHNSSGKKRKLWSRQSNHEDGGDDLDGDEPPRQRRRSNSVCQALCPISAILLLTYDL